MSALYKSESGQRLVHERYRSILDQWPDPNERLRIPTREGETFVLRCGPPEAPPVVLLHGAMATSAMWTDRKSVV